MTTSALRLHSSDLKTRLSLSPSHLPLSVCVFGVKLIASLIPWYVCVLAAYQFMMDSSLFGFWWYTELLTARNFVVLVAVVVVWHANDESKCVYMRQKCFFRMQCVAIVEYMEMMMWWMSRMKSTHISRFLSGATESDQFF